VWVNGRRQAKGKWRRCEYERLRDDLAWRRRDLADPASGTPLVAACGAARSLYSGPHTEDAPDLVVETAPGYHGGFEIDRVVSEVPRATLASVSGSHVPEGIFVAAGGPFRRGVVLDPPSLADVLPTVLHLLGVPLPDDLDGRVVTEALEPEFVAANPVRLAPRQGGAAGRASLSSDDEGEMRKFLQGLGYVE
jgi:predicted AlkP superfamily phosphohydrolase/phosphomutase